jgi:hypothetical protein
MKKWTLALVAAFSAWTGIAGAQPPPADAALRQQIERRFEVLVLSDRLVLQPRGDREVRLIEIADSGIAIDGAPATGAEVRQRLGAEADAVLQLSYLNASQRRALFDPPAAPPVPSVPEPPAAAAPTPAPSPEPPIERERRRTRRSDVVRFGRNVEIEEDELVVGDVVAIGGSVRVNGEVRGEVVSVGGSVDLGPRATVTRDIAVIGGSLRQAEGAQVRGRIHEVGIGEFELGDWQWGWRPGPFPRFSRTLSLMSTLGRVAILCVLGALVMLLAREYVERASLRAAADPLKAGAIGFLAQLLFLPVLVVTIIILVVTIIGLPLLLLIPFAILGLALLALVGFTAIAYRIGQFVSARFGWGVSGPFAPTILGMVAIVSPLLVARLLSLLGGPMVPLAFGLGVVAFLVEYVAWTVGFGAVALARLDRPRPPMPPIAAPPPIVP